MEYAITVFGSPFFAIFHGMIARKGAFSFFSRSGAASLSSFVKRKKSV